MPDPTVRVLVEIRLREHFTGDTRETRALPADVTDEALTDVARRLVGCHSDGQLITTTLWRDPDDMDSAHIEHVGGGIHVLSVEIDRGGAPLHMAPPAPPMVKAATPPRVHALRGGRTLCGIAWSPSAVGPNDTWVAFDDVELLRAVDCPGCCETMGSTAIGPGVADPRESSGMDGADG